MTSARLIQLFLILASALVLGFRFGAGDELNEVFSDQVAITRAQPIERIAGARAGRVVALPPTLSDVVHLVKKGDSWSSIARLYGVYDYNALARYHDFLPLRPGMKLKVPAQLMEAP